MSAFEKSFTRYRDVQSKDEFSSDEDEFVLDSANNTGQSLYISESDSGTEESMIKYSKRKTKPIFIDSECEDDEEDSCENRAFSPRTRLSITGIRPPDISSDESEIDHEESKSINESSPKTRLSVAGIRSPDISSDESEIDHEESKSINESSPKTRLSVAGIRSPDISSDESEIDHEESKSINESSSKTRLSVAGIRSPDISSDESEIDHEESKSINESPHESFSLTGIRPPDISSDEFEIDNKEPKSKHCQVDEPFTSKHSHSSPTTSYESADVESSGDFSGTPINNNRFSTKFNSSISNKLSSTITGTPSRSPKSESFDIEASRTSTKTNGASVEIISFEQPTINISSESENTSPQINPTKAPNLVQRKISAAVFNTRSNDIIRRPEFVSLEFFNKELKKLEELKIELITCKNLISIKSKLPDGGTKMLQRIGNLEIDIKKQANSISNMVVDENEVKRNIVKNNKNVGLPGSPTWDDLANAADAILPTHTGKRGLATFTAQKALTIDRLKDMHCSLETCPDENVLASDPPGLKVVLMSHQKSALTWMDWREKQKPRGGILADDMGLGKTLTMIALIMLSKNREEIEEKVSDEELPEENPNKGWSSKGRKDYYDGGTLVVAPASLIKQWEDEVIKRTKRNLLNVCVHHGTNRDAKPRHLAKFDIVITTYNLVSREFRNTSTLFGIKWKRIILDEAHVIRNHKSQSSISVCGLIGKYRWVLTGTPIQNKEMDLYALLKFLKCTPFDDLNNWKKWIDNKSAGGQQRLSTLIKSLMLRRTKIQLQETGGLIALPEKSITLIEIELDKEEMNVYQKIMIFSRTLFAQYLHQRTEKDTDNYLVYMKAPADSNGAYSKAHQKLSRLHGNTEVKSHEILVLLLRLRQICCHPGLIDSMLVDETDESIISESGITGNSQNDIDLLEQLEKLHINNSGCSVNSNNSLNASKEIAMSKASSKVLLRSNPVFNYDRASSKIKKILEVVQEKILPTRDKAIIVSQWTSVLDIIQSHLSAKNIRCCCLNGKVAVKNRNDIVNNFNSSNSPERIMLLSLTAGGVGLNLVGANHLFLVDLHWNPQLEAQAQDRIYRFGQQKPVKIYKFMCKDTVEERIKKLQDHKLDIASGILTGVKSQAGSKLTLDDLKSIFGM